VLRGGPTIERMPSFAILACEPILPLTMLFMPWTAAAMRVGGIALLIVVLVKCGVFAALQRGAMDPAMAVVSMFIANIVSTLAGVFAALMFIAPMTGFIGILVTIAVSVLPCRRLRDQFPKARVSVVMITVVFLWIGSIALFAFSQKMIFENRLVAYWIIKYASIVCGLLISMGLTTFWEEYVIWKMSGHEDLAFVTPVFRTNAVALFLIMLVAAIAVLPERLRSPDFLIALFFSH